MVWRLCGGSTSKPNRVLPLKGGEVKTPITMLRGEQLKQPPVIANFLADGKFPLTLVWPQKEVDHDVCYMRIQRLSHLGLARGGSLTS